MEYSPANTWVRLIEQASYDYDEIAVKLRLAFEQENVNVANKSVLLKISFVFPVRDFERTKMIITNPTLIVATCQVLIERGAKVIFIGDGDNIYPARYQFEMVGFFKALKLLPSTSRKKVRCAFFDECYKEWIAPENPIISDVKLDIPNLLRDVDVFISMPKLKVNVFANITLSVKNGMGFIKAQTRWKWHNHHLHSLIADIYQIRAPDYVLTDAVFAGEGQGPMQATAYHTGLLILGNNGLAVDTISCNLMGYNPKEIQHLTLLNERGYGPLEMNQIRLESQTIFMTHKHEFKRPEVKLDHVAPNVHYYLGEACDSGCPAFMRGMLDAYGFNVGYENIGELYIIMGKNAPVPKEILSKLPKNRTLIYGSCAKEYKKYGRYYEGCPPNYMLAMMTFGLKTPLGHIPWLKYVGYWTYAKTELIHILSKLRGKRYKNIKEEFP
jgi:uncharacterized protein (DUF362 family)